MKDPKSFIALVVLIIVIVAKTLRLDTKQQVKQALRKLPNAFKYKDEFKLRAPKDKLYIINYFLITFSGVFLIHLVEQPGIIKGSTKDSNWISKRKFRKKEFDNPVAFIEKLPPFVSDITKEVKPDMPIYPVVVFNNRNNIENIDTEEIPVIKANQLLDYINSFDQKVLETPDINVLYDQLREYRFDFE